MTGEKVSLSGEGAQGTENPKFFRRHMASSSPLCTVFQAHSRYSIKCCGPMSCQVAKDIEVAADGETSRATAAMLQPSRDTNTS